MSESCEDDGGGGVGTRGRGAAGFAGALIGDHRGAGLVESDDES